ncbi:MAG: uracil phosphoribosyltransferase [Acidimicrobiia bacterium]
MAFDTASFPQLCVVEHPLVQHKLTYLRDMHTDTATFRRLVAELALLLTYEATRDLELIDHTVQTPLEETTKHALAGKQVAVIPILRAGLGMLDAVLTLLPNARVGFLGAYRDEETATPVRYYEKFPADLDQRDVIILDPMLATGGSAALAVELLKARGARRIVQISLVAAPEGVMHLLGEHPDIRVVTASLDRELNDRYYIVPGLGDAGDRLFGTP